jgi:DNA-binding MarR family transcriptional regulator
MTGLDLLELVVEHPDQTAGRIAELARKRDVLLTANVDGRLMRHALEHLEGRELVTVRRTYDKNRPSTYVPTARGRHLLADVKRARSSGFVPYSSIEGVSTLEAQALARTI